MGSALALGLRDCEPLGCVPFLTSTVLLEHGPFSLQISENEASLRIATQHMHPPGGQS